MAWLFTFMPTTMHSTNDFRYTIDWNNMWMCLWCSLKVWNVIVEFSNCDLVDVIEQKKGRGFGVGGRCFILYLCPGLKELNCQWPVHLLYLIVPICLQSWRNISVSCQTVVESCGSGKLRSIQEVPACIYLEDLIVFRPIQECPLDPLPHHPVWSDWRMS
jgi:hypothetical protein